MSGVPVYEMQVECMAYCYGGSPALEVDEYPDANDPHAVVKYADHVAALADCEARVWKIAYAQGLGAGSDEHGQHEVGFVKGYATALDDAREAVEVAVTDALEALDPLDPQTVNRALAAIDALHDEPCEACNGTGHVKCWSPGGPCPAGQKECECCGPCRQCDSLAAIEALQMEPK